MPRPIVPRLDPRPFHGLCPDLLDTSGGQWPAWQLFAVGRHDAVRHGTAVEPEDDQRRGGDVGQADDASADRGGDRFDRLAGVDGADRLGDERSLARKLRGPDLRAALRSHVAADAHVTGDYPVVITDRRDHRRRLVLGAVLASVDEVGDPWLAGCQGRPHRAIERRRLATAVEHPRVAAQGLGRGIAGDSLEGRVHVLDAPGRVRDHDRLVGLLDRRGKPRDLLLGCPLVGYVVEGDHDAAHGRIGSPIVGGDLDQPVFGVVGEQPDLGRPTGAGSA